MDTATRPRRQADLDEQEWAEYCRDGVARARALGNRGPVRYDDDGNLAADIVDTYRRTGFYVFEGVLSPREVTELTEEFDELIDNAPLAADGTVDGHGRPVRFPGYYSMSSDALFGQSGIDAEAERPVVGLVAHPLMLMDSALRVYGHPDILRIVEAVNGPDFVPFHESIFHKPAGEGPPTPWHQDGRTHWDDSGAALEGDDGVGPSHGFNLNVSWSECTPDNCLWVVPGSQRQWRLTDGGAFPTPTEVLDDAVPMTLAPGDCALVNRSSLHGSYRNGSDVRRVTMVMGFHKRASAVGTTTTNVHAFKVPGGGNSLTVTYSDEHVSRRARMIPLAIDARRSWFTDETPYEYRGEFLGSATWNDDTRAEISRDGDEYWRGDLTL